MSTNGATSADDDSLTRESDLLRGVRSAISRTEGAMDQSAIDEALGIRHDGGSASKPAGTGAPADPTG